MQTSSGGGIGPVIGMLLVRHANSSDPDAVLVDDILPGSCADLCRPNIQRGDYLLSVSGTPVICFIFNFFLHYA